MSFLLVISSETLQQDLIERKGRNRLEQQAHAQRQRALQDVLARLVRDFARRGGDMQHLRADVFDEPLETRVHFPPASFGQLLARFAAIVPMPADGACAAAHPHSYLVSFDFARLELSVVAAYVEDTDGAALVMMEAKPTEIVAQKMRFLARGHVAFDTILRDALRALDDARS